MAVSTRRQVKVAGAPKPPARPCGLAAAHFGHWATTPSACLTAVDAPDACTFSGLWFFFVAGERVTSRFHPESGRRRGSDLLYSDAQTCRRRGDFAARSVLWTLKRSILWTLKRSILWTLKCSFVAGTAFCGH